MRNRLLLIAGMAIGIALLASLIVPNRLDRTIAPQSTAVGPPREPALDLNRPDANLSESNTVTAGAADAIGEVSVFDHAFTIRVYSTDVLDAFTPYREEPITDYYDSLAQAGNAGDAQAALELGFVLQRCRGYATTEQQLDDKLNAMSQTHLLQGPYYPRPRLVEGIGAWMEIERQRYKICRGLSSEQIMGFHDWFALAAELGDYYAQTGAIRRARDRYWLAQGAAPVMHGFDDAVSIMTMFAAAEPEELRRAMEHMFAARTQGSLQALHDLALLYAARVLQPPNEHSPTANAYANLRAASEVWHRIWDAGSYNYDEDLRRLSDRLTLYEFDWAEDQAQAILRADNCCREP
jgi:hypothetical protein